MNPHVHQTCLKCGGCKFECEHRARVISAATTNTTLMTKQPNTHYKKLAKDFGCHLRFGRFGVQFFPRDPGGNIYKLFQVIPLDGWITDPEEVERVMRERGLEL